MAPIMVTHIYEDYEVLYEVTDFLTPRLALRPRPNVRVLRQGVPQPTKHRKRRWRHSCLKPSQWTGTEQALIVLLDPNLAHHSVWSKPRGAVQPNSLA